MRPLHPNLRPGFPNLRHPFAPTNANHLAVPPVTADRRLSSGSLCYRPLPTCPGWRKKILSFNTSMSSLIYVDPAATTSQVICVNGVCYTRVGPSSMPPNTFAGNIGGVFTSCSGCGPASIQARNCSSGSLSGLWLPQSSIGAYPFYATRTADGLIYSFAAADIGCGGMAFGAYTTTTGCTACAFCAKSQSYLTVTIAGATIGCGCAILSPDFTGSFTASGDINGSYFLPFAGIDEGSHCVYGTILTVGVTVNYYENNSDCSGTPDLNTSEAFFAVDFGGSGVVINGYFSSLDAELGNLFLASGTDFSSFCNGSTSSLTLSSDYSSCGETIERQLGYGGTATLTWGC
jgi:hypothetical protein